MKVFRGEICICPQRFYFPFSFIIFSFSPFCLICVFYLLHQLAFAFEINSPQTPKISLILGVWLVWLVEPESYFSLQQVILFRRFISTSFIMFCEFIRLLLYFTLILMHFTHASSDKEDGELGFQKGSSQDASVSVLHKCAIKQVIKSYSIVKGGKM